MDWFTWKSDRFTEALSPVNEITLNHAHLRHLTTSQSRTDLLTIKSGVLWDIGCTELMSTPLTMNMFSYIRKWQEGWSCGFLQWQHWWFQNSQPPLFYIHVCWTHNAFLSHQMKQPHASHFCQSSKESIFASISVIVSPCQHLSTECSLAVFCHTVAVGFLSMSGMLKLAVSSNEDTT